MNELKPCPFCGGEAKIMTHESYVPESWRSLVGVYGVVCTSCRAGGYQFWDTEEQAIAAWNRRADDAGYAACAAEIADRCMPVAKEEGDI